MILTKEVEIKVNVSNRDYFQSIGYGNLKIKQEIVVPIEKLMKFSKVEILVKCDNCNDEDTIKFCRHSNPHYCKKCYRKYLTIKMRETKLKKYGNSSYVNPEKMIKTKLEKYGTLDVSEKVKKSVQEKYGVDNVFQLNEIKEKIKERNLELYGVEYTSQRNDVKKKMKKIFDDKYGGFLMGSILKSKIVKKILDKYGVENISQNEDIKKKKEETSMKNYGHPYFPCTDKYKIMMGILLDKDIKNDWQLYKRQSRRIFDKIKPEVYKNWNGYDFYDKEYIKENLNLHYNDINYPTVDHKLSVFYGFMNNISVDEINKIENLVVTKRSINSAKGKKEMPN